jgi:hypothetical protein
MAAWGRDTPWRQGHVLPDDAAEAVGVLTEAPTGAVAIVVSHDCDLAQDPSVEPRVEVIVGRRITTANGNFTYAKNARRLHLTFSGGAEHLTAELEASRKSPVAKDQLAEYEPIETVRLTPIEHNILQRWLAARYRRSAFPDEFDRRLERTGVRDRLSNILKSAGALIAAIYFDVDQGEEISRTGSDDPYTLAIYLLFSTETDPEAAERAAETAKTAIRKAFRDRCLSKETGTWRDIELIECDAISDQAMTVQQAESLKRWLADHISLRTEPAQAMLRDE